METVSIDAERAFALMFELLKAKPWLNSAGVMKPQDSSAEAEAVAFLLTAAPADDWEHCTPAARRIVNALLLDFMAKLRTHGSALSGACWLVPAAAPEWRQALDLVAQEIRRSHPRLATKH